MSEKKSMPKARKVLLVTVAAIAVGAGGFWFAESQGMLGSINGALAPAPAPIANPGFHPIVQAASPASTAAKQAASQLAGPPGAAAPARPTSPTTGGATAQAANPSVTPGATNAAVDTAFFAQDATLQRQLRLLKLQEQVRKLQDKLNKLDGGAPHASATPARVTVSSPAPSGRPDATTRTVSRVSIPVMPALPSPPPFVLKSVLGVGDSYTAVIADHGVSEAVHVGDHLRGGWAVSGIWPRHVVLSRGRTTQIVRLGG